MNLVAFHQKGEYYWLDEEEPIFCDRQKAMLELIRVTTQNSQSH